MNKEKKIEYTIELLIGLGLIKEKILYIQGELMKKDESDINKMLTKLEKYYTDQNLIDKEFIRKLDRINNQVDESIESTIEKSQMENLIF
ncbi:MAG: hypothetical protein PHQ95_02730 [Candidatus Gracilibacteria bacterium]|nr:hypothetical protein [Candidatus Gracilibacteria bacterium]